VLSNLAQWWRVLCRPPKVRLAPPKAGEFVAIAVVLVAIIVSMFTFDAAAINWARGLPQWFDDLFEQITDFGLSGWFLFPFGFVLLFLAAITARMLTQRTRVVLAALTVRFGFLFLAIAIPGLFVTLVKGLIGRARPYVGGHDDPFAYMPFTWLPEHASMPSGHSVTAASVAIAIGAIWPRTRGILWIYALIIMFSRVVVIAHHPSDVIAGALVGTVGAELVRRWFAARGLLFSPIDLRAFAGPSFNQVVAAVRESLFRRKPVEKPQIPPS
jgi:membrane-associated phospholipid phosphatase